MVMELISRLEGVRETARDCWVAKCPAHDDRTPSLSIKHADGRVLVHCFGGCPATDVVAAVGLQLSDLFDEPLPSSPPMTQWQRKRQNQAQHALKSLVHDARIVMCAAGRMAAGHGISGDHMDELHEASQRIFAAAKIVV